MENISGLDNSAMPAPPEFSDSERDLSTIRNDDNSSHLIDKPRKKPKRGDQESQSMKSSEKKEEPVMYDKPEETAGRPERDTDYSNSIYFKEVAEAFLKIEKIQGSTARDLKKEVLSTLFARVIENHPKDLSKLYYFLVVKLGPTYLVPEIQMTEDKIEALVGKVLDLNEYILNQNLKQTGDLGQVAYDVKKSSEEMNRLHNYQEEKAQENLYLQEVMNVFEEFALEEENEAQKMQQHKFKMNKNKSRLIYNLLERADKDEIKFLIRFLEKNLKLGVPLDLIFESISKAISKVLGTLSEKDVHKILMTSYNQLVDEDIP